MYLNVLFMLIFQLSLPIIKCQRFVRMIGANFFRYKAIYSMAQMLIFFWTRVAWVIQCHHFYNLNIYLAILLYLGLVYKSCIFLVCILKCAELLNHFYLTIYLNGIAQFNRNVCLINGHILLFQEDPDDKLPFT